MKYFFIFAILILTLSSGALAQPATPPDEIKWTRIETEKKELSAAFPPNFIVDAEKKENGRRYTITGWQNGVRMELHVTKNSNARDQLRFVRARGEGEFSDFTVNGLKGKRNSVSASGKFSENIHLASDEYYYLLKTEAGDGTKEEIKRFLFSIQVKGKAMYVSDKKPDSAEETVALADLKTSPEVLEALNRKVEKTQIKITRELAPLPSETVNDENLSRPPIVVFRPRIEYRPNSEQGGSFEATLKVNFLANGQIGDITVYSGADKGFVNACIDAVRKIKFIPAQINGKNVDSIDTEYYAMQIFKLASPTMLPPGRPF
jgi:hypothetical protein